MEVCYYSWKKILLYLTWRNKVYSTFSHKSCFLNISSSSCSALEVLLFLLFSFFVEAWFPSIWCFRSTEQSNTITLQAHPSHGICLHPPHCNVCLLYKNMILFTHNQCVMQNKIRHAFLQKKPFIFLTVLCICLLLF